MASGVYASYSPYPSPMMPHMNGVFTPVPPPGPTFAPHTGLSSAQAPAQGNRRQRITMACTYCRHRKIKCCGDKPTCRNCSRSDRTCQYAAVPLEENKLTRDKKAHSKAAKARTTSSKAAAASFVPQHNHLAIPPVPAYNQMNHSNSSTPVIQAGGIFSSVQLISPASQYGTPDSFVHNAYLPSPSMTYSPHPSNMSGYQYVPPPAEYLYQPNGQQLNPMVSPMPGFHTAVLPAAAQVNGNYTSPYPLDVSTPHLGNQTSYFSNLTPEATFGTAPYGVPMAHTSIVQPAQSGVYTPDYFAPAQPSPLRQRSDNVPYVSPTLAAEYDRPKADLIGLGIDMRAGSFPQPQFFSSPAEDISPSSSA